MKISLTDAGKRFNREWIFRHVTYIFESGVSYAITGPNGSGKSTFLQAIGGSLHINEGRIEYAAAPTYSFTVNSNIPSTKTSTGLIPDDEIYSETSICAPYLELIEELTIKEFLDFHCKFKPFLPGITTESIITAVGLEKAVNKQIRYFSSGMKQRVKLAQCIFSNTSIVLLDEPCTNLDTDGIRLYHELINQYCKSRLTIVSSNDEVEYNFCNVVLSMTALPKLVD